MGLIRAVGLRDAQYQGNRQFTQMTKHGTDLSTTLGPVDDPVGDALKKHHVIVQRVIHNLGAIDHLACSRVRVLLFAERRV